MEILRKKSGSRVTRPVANVMATPDSRTKKAAVAYDPTLRMFLAKTHRGAVHLSGQEVPFYRHG